MSVAPGLEESFNSACPECGLAGWEHAPDCSYDCPDDQPAAVDLTDISPVEGNT